MTDLSSDAAIDHIAGGLIDRTLPKAEWTHAAHFAAALWLIRDRGVNAARDMPELIRAYNAATDTPNTDTGGYHETITLASLRAAHAWLADRPDTPLYVALTSLLASQYGNKNWLLGYWSRPLLFSVAARRTWVEPDLQTLPF